MLTVLSLCAALGYGVSDFAGGLAARRIRPLTALLYGEPAGALLIAVLVFLLPGHLTWAGTVMAALAGLVGLGGLTLLYRLMADQPLTIIAPMTAVLAAAVPLAAGVVDGERPGPFGWIGIMVGFVAVVMLTSGRDEHGGRRASSRVVLLALASGIAFGAYFVLVAHAGRDCGMFTLLIARLSAVVILAPLARSRGLVTAPRGGAAVAALLAGVLDAVADVSFLLASRSGHLYFVSVITGLYPAVTALLALIVLRERKGWVPGAGLGLSIVSIALLTQ